MKLGSDLLSTAVDISGERETAKNPRSVAPRALGAGTPRTSLSRSDIGRSARWARGSRGRPITRRCSPRRSGGRFGPTAESISARAGRVCYSSGRGAFLSAEWTAIVSIVGAAVPMLASFRGEGCPIPIHGDASPNFQGQNSLSRVNLRVASGEKCQGSRARAFADLRPC
jgi:hypothetical protein